MPGQYRWGVNRLGEALAGPVADGLASVILFGVLGVRFIAQAAPTVGACAS